MSAITRHSLDPTAFLPDSIRVALRRRLREIVRLGGGASMLAGHDYVLVGRRDALTMPFDKMTDEFARALRRLHEGRKGR